MPVGPCRGPHMLLLTGIGTRLAWYMLRSTLGLVKNISLKGEEGGSGWKNTDQT